MSEFDSKLCDEKHGNLDRRLTVVEESIKNNLERIYAKLDRPSWVVTVIISILSSACIGLAVAAVK